MKNLRKTSFNALEVIGLLSLAFTVARFTIFAQTSTPVPPMGVQVAPKTLTNNLVYIPRKGSVPKGLQVQKVRDSLANKGTKHQYRKGTFYKILNDQ